MSVHAITHLNFRGNARQALGFYHSVFGGQLTVVTYKEAGNVTDASEAEQLIWGQVAADSGFRVMAYDVPSHTSWHLGENAFFIVVEGETAQEISAYWEKLVDGATVVQALAPSPWSPLYGMLKDRFGVEWSLSVANPHNG